MPYFVTDDSPSCSGWATIKSDGEVIGCHKTKVQAVAQMVAVSLSEKIEPGGERLKHKKNKKIMYRVLPDNYRPSLSPDVPDGRACGNCYFYIESNVKEFDDGELRAWCEKWDDYVNGAYYCNAWQESDDDDDENNDDYEERAPVQKKVSLSPPTYMRAAARRGLELNRQGFGGDGLTDKTKQEARDMAAGRVSEDKWRRIGPWIARHLVDLDAPKNNNPDDKDYPGAGLVAHLLWGSGPTRARALAAMNYAENVVEKLDEERHLPGGHDQLTHGSGGGAGSKARDLVADGTITQGNSLDRKLQDKIGLYNHEKRFGEGITSEDEALDEIAKMQGFDALPQRSTDWDEFNRIKPPEVVGTNGEKIMATSEYRLSRGFDAGKLPDGSAISAQDAKKSFTDGEYFAGMGVYGNGIYSTTDLSLAMRYTKNNDMADVSQFKLATDSKVASFAKISDEMYKKQNIENDLPLSLSNVGRYAAARGYDAIKIDVESSTQFLVLNRGKVILSPDYSSGDVVEP